MDRKYTEMLSVKNAIERTIQGLVSTHVQANSTSNAFFGAVERLVASFFVTQQIDNNYLVRSTQSGDVEIRFSTQGHSTCLTYILPNQLRWIVEIQIPQRKKPLTFAGEVLALQEEEKSKQANVKKDQDEEAALRKEWLDDKLDTISKWSDGYSVTPEPKNPLTGTVWQGGPLGELMVYDGTQWVEMTPQILAQRAAQFANTDIVCEGSIRHNSSTGGLEMFTNGKWVPMPGSRKSANGDPSMSAPVPNETPEQAYERAKKHVEGMK